MVFVRQLPSPGIAKRDREKEREKYISTLQLDKTQHNTHTHNGKGEWGQLLKHKEETVKVSSEQQS